MKERPILFSGAMVRAILDGRKTVTRRTVKGIALDWIAAGFNASYVADDANGLCPYGCAGDRLWVRETWSSSVSAEDLTPRQIVDQRWPIWYAADSECRFLGADDGGPGFMERERRWRPSIHMPRWASRITLEVTGVRVERLQDISEADAQAEGAQFFRDLPIGSPGPNPQNRWSMESPPNTDHCLSTARLAFANLFCKVNGKPTRHEPIDFAPWESNPFVWVVEFRRLP